MDNFNLIDEYLWHTQTLFQIEISSTKFKHCLPRISNCNWISRFIFFFPQKNQNILPTPFWRWKFALRMAKITLQKLTKSLNCNKTSINPGGNLHFLYPLPFDGDALHFIDLIETCILQCFSTVKTFICRYRYFTLFVASLYSKKFTHFQTFQMKKQYNGIKQSC